MPTRTFPTPFPLRPPADLPATRPDLVRAAHALSVDYAKHERFVDDRELQALGHALWDALAAADPSLPARFDAARAAAGTLVLPLIVESDSPAVLRLPWETLHHPRHGFLGRADAFTLARRAPGPAPVALPPDPGPLRVALFTCLPDDLDAMHGRLDVEEQQARALAALGGAVNDGRVRLEMPDDGRFSTFRALFRAAGPDAPAFDPHVLFLFAHGKFHNAAGQSAPPHATVQFEAESGGSDFVHETDLAAAFSGSGIQCVVLTVCESGMGDGDDLAAGLAGRLAAAGVPHVLGMRETVLERAGIAFNAAFAAAIVAGERADVALQRGRAAITTPLAGALGPGDDPRLAALSLGQWPLPALISHDPARPLIDWAFTPRPPERVLNRDTVGNTVLLPPRFIGRRRELRDWKEPLRRGQRPVLLITGPGGQGKTALAGKLANDWAAAEGVAPVVWSARAGMGDWDAFYLGLIARAGADAFRQATAGLSDETARAEVLLELLRRRAGGRLLVFVDNLETLQDPDTLALSDARLAAFLAAARALAPAGLRLLATSRFRPPDWPAAAELPLRPALPGDFLQMALAERAPAAFWQPGRPRRIYATLNGNGRGLRFFAAAVAQLGDAAAEEAFLAALAAARDDVRVDMALAALVAHLDGGARALLDRLPAYDTPVPVEGVIKLALDRPDAAAALDRLLAVGLVERYDDHEWQTQAYQLSPLVAAWLAEQPGAALAAAWLSAAADYQQWLYDYERPTLAQAITLHRALTRAGRQAAADRLALGDVLRPLHRAGLYRVLLDAWLPALRRSADDSVRAAGLGWSGTCHRAQGEYAAALEFHEQSLDITRAIGDRAGEGATLNNISQIYDAQGDYPTALEFLRQSLDIQRAIGDRAGEGTTLNNMATAAHAQGDTPTALEFLRQSLDIRRAIGDRAGEGRTLNNISQIYKAQGDTPTALEFLRQSLDITRAIGDRAGEGATLNNMATAAHAQGDYPTALEFLRQSLDITRAIGDAAGLCATLFNMGHIHLQNGEVNEAFTAWVTVYQLASRIGLAQALQNLEQLAGQVGLPGGLAGWAALASGELQLSTSDAPE